MMEVGRDLALTERKEAIMKSIENVIVSEAGSAETRAKKRRLDGEVSVVAVVILTGLMIWTGLLLFSVPGALDAVAAVVASPW
jgi:hypothetical protein